jgi:hypothetical protein
VEGFLNKGECQYFSDFVHMNKPGNEFFAEIVFKSIVSLEKMRKLNGWNASTPTPESLLNLVQCNMSTFIERLPWYEDKDKNFNSDGGYCYIFDLPGDVKWEMWDDTNASPEYHVYLYENNELLPFPRTVNHDEIRVKGMGRYSHWQDRIYFSNTDNSNPNKNSRSYRIKYY